VEICAVGIHYGKIPNFVRTCSEKDLLPVSRPARVIRIVTRDIFENGNFSRANIDNRDMTRVRRVARFFGGVKRDASSIRRDRREDSVRDLFFTCAIEIGYPDSLVPFKRDLPIAAKN
jgi:hypothetical protein